MQPIEALKKAISIAGNQTILAEKLNIRPSSISVMLNRDKHCSPKYVAKISELTGVPCYELRPDIFPKPLTKETPCTTNP